MLSEYITSLADVIFHIVAYMYALFRFSGKNPMRFAVVWRISVRSLFQRKFFFFFNKSAFPSALLPDSMAEGREKKEI